MKTLAQCLFVLLFMGLLPLSCTKYSDRGLCGDLPPIRDFHIEEITTSYVDERGELQDTNYHPQYSSFINIEVGRRTYAIGFEAFHIVPFVSVSYACEPRAARSLEYLKTVEVVSNIGTIWGNDTIDPGDTITRFFGLGIDRQLKSVTTFLTDDDYHFSEGTYGSLFLGLSEDKGSYSRFNFDIYITLSDNREFKIPNQTMKIY